MNSTMTMGYAPKNKFPKLMINTSKDLVVLFYKEGYGQVVHTEGSNYYVGEHSQTWNSQVFVDFHGTITITA